jgi:hypothetical protein
VTAVQQAKVVVSKLPDSDGQVRTGALLARQGPILTVRWDDDGREEDVRISTTTTFVVPGSVRHQGLVDPAALIARLKTEPVTVFVELLREYGPAMTATELKEKLTDLGLDTEAVSKAWRRAQPKLGEVEEVRAAKNKNSYRWIRPKPEATDAEPETADAPAAREDLDVQKASANASLSASEETATASDVPKRIEQVADLPTGEAEAQSAPDTPPSLAQALAAALGEEPAPDVLHYAERPLATAARLGQLDDARLERLVTSVREEEQAQCIALLAALPRSAKPIDAVRMTAADPVSIRAVLAASVAELRERPSADPQVMSAVGWLLRRVVGLSLNVEAMPSLIGLAAAIAVDPGKNDLETLDHVARVLHRQLPLMDQDEREVVDLDAVARIAAKLPFSPQGGRPALMSVVSRVWSERVTEEIWWRDATLTNLADCAAGLLGGVTSRPDVAARVIAPLMMHELSKVTSRIRLGKLLALPAEFVEHLAPDRVANAFRRVAGNDPVVESWLRMLAPGRPTTAANL